MLYSHVHDAPTPLSEVAPGLPGGLAAVVERALEEGAAGPLHLGRGVRHRLRGGRQRGIRAAPVVTLVSWSNRRTRFSRRRRGTPAETRVAGVANKSAKGGGGGCRWAPMMKRGGSRLTTTEAHRAAGDGGRAATAAGSGENVRSDPTAIPRFLVSPAAPPHGPAFRSRCPRGQRRLMGPDARHLGGLPRRPLRVPLPLPSPACSTRATRPMQRSPPAVRDGVRDARTQRGAAGADAWAHAPASAVFMIV